MRSLTSQKFRFELHYGGLGSRRTGDRPRFELGDTVMKPVNEVKWSLDTRLLALIRFAGYSVLRGDEKEPDERGFAEREDETVVDVVDWELNGDCDDEWHFTRSRVEGKEEVGVSAMILPTWIFETNGGDAKSFEEWVNSAMSERRKELETIRAFYEFLR